MECAQNFCFLNPDPAAGQLEEIFSTIHEFVGTRLQQSFDGFFGVEQNVDVASWNWDIVCSKHFNYIIAEGRFFGIGNCTKPRPLDYRRTGGNWTNLWYDTWDVFLPSLAILFSSVQRPWMHSAIQLEASRSFYVEYRSDFLNTHRKLEKKSCNSYLR